MEKLFQLQPYAPNSKISRYVVAISRVAPLRLRMHFRLEGDLSELALRLEKRQPGLWGFELWKETCFELFLSFPNEKKYWEWNFSPSGEICLYRLSDYRTARPDDCASRAYAGGFVAYNFSSDAKTLSYHVDLDLSADAELSWYVQTQPRMEINLSSILVDQSGENTYWALGHNPAKPDFHARAAWKLFD